MENQDRLEQTNEEIDKALAEKFLGLTENDHGHWSSVKTGIMFSRSKWNPTHKDSNQLVNYVLPKLKWNISTYNSDDKRYFEITLTHRIKGGDKDGQWLEVQKRTKNDDHQINRTIAIACLEAWDALGEGVA